VEKCGGAREARDNNIIRRMRCACWVTKTTETRSEYVILMRFPRQQWLRERFSILRYKYFACRLNVCFLNKQERQCRRRSNILARSRNHCCSGKPTMHFVFSTLSHKRRDYTEHKLCVLIIMYLQLLSNTFLIRRRMQRYIIVNLQGSSCKVTFILVKF
jgi:hypothetical protein